MKNRAKCRLCSDIIESKEAHDHIICGCGEIAIEGGGQFFRQMAKKKENFIRLKDDNTELLVPDKVTTPTQTIIEELKMPTPTYEELFQILVDKSNAIEAMPDHAMHIAINHYDYGSLLLLLVALFKERCAKDN